MINLSPLEIDKLQVLLSDEVLMATIYKVFQKAVDDKQPKVFDESNTILGEKYRAYEGSKKIVAQGFNDLREFTKGKEDVPSSVLHL